MLLSWIVVIIICNCYLYCCLKTDLINKFYWRTRLYIVNYLFSTIISFSSKCNLLSLILQLPRISNSKSVTVGSAIPCVTLRSLQFHSRICRHICEPDGDEIRQAGGPELDTGHWCAPWGMGEERCLVLATNILIFKLIEFCGGRQISHTADAWCTAGLRARMA